MENNISTVEISSSLFSEIKEALTGIDFGSVEIFIADGEVTQITRRQIKKTNGKFKSGK